MPEIKRVAPPLFEKVDLIPIVLLIALICAIVIDGRDAIEHKSLKIAVVLLTVAAIKGISTIAKIYYPSSQEKSLSLSSSVFAFLVCLLIGPLQSIVTWHHGDHFKEHVQHNVINLAILFFILLFTKTKFQNKK